ncbi:hypothetical protein ABTY61_32390 [Kitasatospora sp. NPDC096128]|uniref:hypothetical protein n=1 Tax=Kitasatospora sp. NPDC096128 TaxID=3155547 RepID=UPI00331B185B
MDLPDIYETRQRALLRETYLAGDHDRTRQIGQHLVIEGIATPEEQEQRRDLLRCTALFHTVIRAGEAGDIEKADRLRQHIAQVFPPRAIKEVTTAGVLGTGLQQVLTRDQHNQLLAGMQELGAGPELLRLAGTITIR